MCPGKCVKADVVNRAPAATNYDRRAVEQDAIHQTGGEKRGGCASAALHEQVLRVRHGAHSVRVG